jgi:hypothetical protein
MVAERFNRLAAAKNKRNDTWWESGLLHQLDQSDSSHWDAIRRLQEEAVASGDCIGQEPQWDHAWEVKWRYCGNNSEGLAPHVLVYPRCDVLVSMTLEKHWGSARDLDVLDTAPYLPLSFGIGLAALVRDDSGEFVEMSFEQILQSKERLNTLANRSFPPRCVTTQSGSSGLIDFIWRCERKLGNRLTSGWISNQAAFARADLPYAPDMMPENRKCHINSFSLQVHEDSPVSSEICMGVAQTLT